MHNSIMGSVNAERAPNQKDWIALQERLNSDKLEKQIAINKMLSSELAKIINERIERLEKRVKKLENKSSLVSNTAQEPKWDNKTSAPRLESK